MEILYLPIFTVSTVMLKNAKNIFVNETLSRFSCIVDQNLMSLFCVHISISFNKISNTTDRNEAQTMTEPCFTDGCGHSLLCLSSELLHTCWSRFQPEISHLEPSLHQACCHWFSAQLLCNLAVVRLFLLLSIREWLLDSYTSIETISDKASVNGWWINWRASCFSQVLCQVFAGYCSSAADSFF